MSNFRLLTIDEAPDYLVQAGIVEQAEPLRCTELGGGVSSVVILAETTRQRVVLKQALPKLKVQADWPSRPDRSLVEVAALETCAAFVPSGAVPIVLHSDPQRHCFVMTAASKDAHNWKTQLLAGAIDPNVALRAGAILAAMHLGSRHDLEIARRFDDREFFHTLRVDPYLWEVCRVYPDLEPSIKPLVSDMLSHRQALVHGDYSPKNMLVHDTDLLILDFEVAHWGDPAFDLAFCMNHFVLKAVHNATASDRYLDLVTAFWEGYAPALSIESASTLLPRTLLLLGGLLLARIDGKSPVEYLTDDEKKNRVRTIGRRLLHGPTTSLDAMLTIVRSRH